MRVSGVQYSDPVGKSLRLVDGVLTKTPLARAPEGKAINETFATIEDYFDWRIALDAYHDVMLLCGTWNRDDAAGLTVVYKDDLEQFIDADAGDGIAADGAHLSFNPVPSVMRIDTDSRVDAEIFARQFATLDEYHAAMVAAVPWLNGVGALVYDSSSSMVFNGDAQVSGRRGIRLELSVSDASYIPALLANADERCWAAGLGWAFIDTAGVIHLRSPVDLAMGRPTQPDFIAPTLAQGLTSRRELRRIAGGVLDVASATAVPDDIAQIATVKRAAAQAQLESKAAALREAHTAARIKTLVAAGVPEERAVALIAGARAVLYEYETVIIGSKSVTVETLLRDGAKYHRRGCADPLTPAYDGGRKCAVFDWDKGRMPYVMSYAHSTPIRYDLRFDGRRVADALTDADDLDAFTQALARSAGLSESAFQAAMKAAAAKFKTKVGAVRSDVESWRSSGGSFIKLRRVLLKTLALPAGVVRSDTEVVGAWRFPVTVKVDDTTVRVKDHWKNIAFVLDYWDFVVEYCQIRKRILWRRGNTRAASSPQEGNALISALKSICAVNNVPTATLWPHVMHAAVELHGTNFVRDHLKTLAWDGQDRFAAFAAALKCDDGVATEIILRLWFIQSVAAADLAETAIALDPTVHRVFEHVLLIIGGQGTTKSKSIEAMLPTGLRGKDGAFTGGVTLDVGDRDSLKPAISAWIVEWGEIEQTFKRSEVEAIKAYLSRPIDEMRLPYAPTWARFPRSTSYVATANTSAPNKDLTGSRRLWPVRPGVDLLDALEGVDVDQLWAQAWAAYAAGAKWWPMSDVEVAAVERASESARHVSDLEGQLMKTFDWSVPPSSGKRMTLREVLEAAYGGLGTFGAREIPQSVVDKAAYTMQDTIVKLYADAARDRGEQAGANNTVVTQTGDRAKVYASGGKNSGYLLPPTRLVTGLAAAANEKSEGRKAIKVVPIRRDLMGQ